MRIVIAALVALLAAPAAAQETAPKPAAGSATVSGVTVEGRKVPDKGCGARDDACIAAVVAELKARYPKQLQQWCDHVGERAAMTDLMFDRNAGASTDGHPHSNVLPYLPPPVTKIACTTDKR